MVKIYGIKNCDTMKKAFAWLQENGIAFELQDYKKGALTAALASQWISVLGLEAIINKRGTTYRKLDETQKAALENPASAVDIMLAEPSLIKRPLLEANGKQLLGFSQDSYQAFFKS
ncbi:MAG: ArsC family reductase [Oceanospirillaceae bacterium]|nr:ArsC family reductase [Oceanospirillaceae bacterium]MCP5350867.1 ArsC family reductase [Oceanospirillaceae bacterium]